MKRWGGVEVDRWRSEKGREVGRWGGRDMAIVIY